LVILLLLKPLGKRDPVLFLFAVRRNPRLLCTRILCHVEMQSGEASIANKSKDIAPCQIVMPLPEKSAQVSKI